MKLISKTIVLFVGTVAAIGIVAGLFGLSERIIHHHNNFVRRFPQHVAYEKQKIDLKYNSYYFAGTGNGKLFLGNITTPLYITTVDLTKGELQKYKIQADTSYVKLKAPRIKIHQDKFYLYEGSSPYIFMGSIKNWKAELILDSGNRFTILEPADTSNIVVRFQKINSGEGLLGTIDLKNTGKQSYMESLLQPQTNAFFDTDGCLAFDSKLNQFVYTYFYRNQFILADKNLKLIYRGNTIDTISKAKINLTKLENGRQTFANPPMTVNRLTAADSGLLFVNSMLPGQFEGDRIWKVASIIDVYDLTERTYRSSFPIYHLNGKKLRAMMVRGNELYVLIDTHLVCYGLRENLTAKLKHIQDSLKP